MIEELQIRGKWFLPSNSRRGVSGTLTFSLGEEPALEIDGGFEKDDEFTSSLSRKRVDPEIILGIATDGKEITLYKCHERTSKRNEHTRFSASAILMGHHFRSSNDIHLKQLRIELTNLNEWYDHPWLETPEHLPKRFSVKTSEPDKVRLLESEDCTVDIESLWSSNWTRSEVKVSRKVQFLVSFSTPHSLESCLDIIRKLQNFLALAMGKAPYPLSLTAARDRQYISRGRVRNKPIAIYYRPVLPYDAKAIYGPEMLFTLTDLRNDNVALRNWLDSSESIAPVFLLYFAIQHSPFMYLETRFLYLAQAVETFHRRTYGGKYEDDEKYLKGLYLSLVNSLPSDIDKGFRESLVKGKFRYAHEFSLRKRLTDILREFREYLPDNVFRNRVHREQFVSDVVASRNYLTHYDDQSLEETAKRKDLFYLEQRLKLIIEAIFLGIIGFSPQKARGCLEKSTAYDFIQAEDSL